MNRFVSDVLDRLVADIEAGKNPWKKSWKGGAGGMPLNGTTGRTYKGINTLLLWCATEDKGYGSNRWATFKQWAGDGRFVRKGEKGTQILFYKILEKGQGEDATRFPMLRVSTVFNEQQLNEDMCAEEEDPPNAEERHKLAQQWFDGAGITVVPGAPSYRPALDRIAMPPAADFISLDEYWTTMFHEGVHWTGHKSRLNRSASSVASDPTYAAEELVAEIGAAFMGAYFGIDTEKNNAAYLRGWLSRFTDKRQAIFTAAKDAGRAFEFLTQQQAMEIAA